MHPFKSGPASSLFFYRNPSPIKEHIMSHPRRRRYGVFAFLLDIILVFITGGLWLIWIFVREMRNR